jgi:TonB family protein
MAGGVVVPEQMTQEQIENPDVHLQRLIAPELEVSWRQGFVRNIKELFRPTKLPPLEVTSKPVPVQDIWGFYGGQEKKAGALSLLVHAGLVALILFIGSLPPVQKAIKEHVLLIAPDIAPYKPEVQRGGGGGGTRAPDTQKGRLPKIAPRQFTPPTVTPPQDPKLPMTPTLIADTPLPNINDPNMGDPMSRLGSAGGSGLGGGIGSGIGTGVGPGRGPGFGPGSGGGFGGGVYRIGGGVSAPIPISKPEPEYSEEARKAKWQGTVVLAVVVDANGNPQNLRVVKSLGLGLDQKAIEAVEKWRFKPGMKDGKPVPVAATIEVNFRLL